MSVLQQYIFQGSQGLAIKMINVIMSKIGFMKNPIKGLTGFYLTIPVLA
jgi:hypothetical protein